MSGDTFTKRNIIKATGAAFTVGVGSVAPVSAHCTSCDECTPCEPCDARGDHHRFCGNECVVTVEETEAYDICPFDALSHVTTLESGRAGFIADTCENGCEQGLKVDFGCSDTWWVEADDVCSGDDTNCLC